MATPTPYDQASRYLVKLFPHESLAWMLKLDLEDLEFVTWIDSKLPEALGQPDRQTDTVAEIVRKDILGPLWAIIIEYQSYIDAHMHNRVFDYGNKIQWRVKPTKNKSDNYQIGAVVLNLTGVQKRPTPSEWKKAGFLMKINYPILNLETISAKSILKKVIAQELPINLLGFIPLMKGGCEPGIIKKWLAEATKVEDKTIRADLGAIVKTFAGLIKQKEVWEDALEGWNVVESQFLKEQNAVAEARGKVLGNVESTQKSLILVLRQRFGKSTPHEKKISKIQDLERLERMQEVFFTVSSWDEILEVE